MIDALVLTALDCPPGITQVADGPLPTGDTRAVEDLEGKRSARVDRATADSGVEGAKGNRPRHEEESICLVRYAVVTSRIPIRAGANPHGLLVDEIAYSKAAQQRHPSGARTELAISINKHRVTVAYCPPLLYRR